MFDNTVYDLVLELLKLAGRGASNRYLPARLPVLCSLAKAQGDPWQKGQMALEFLLFEIGCCTHPILFQGNERSARTMQLVWILDLDLHCTKKSSPVRKELAANDVLGLGISWETWRKGPEQEALYLLATHIVSAT